ncbi:MAG TPA: potassium transporter TrkA, partial [Micrococcus luteus]|nr:potassium transporter TrkA [Micrococcus luteus]
LEAGGAALSEFRVPAEHWLEGRRIGTVSWPQEAPLVAVVRDGAPRQASADEVLEVGDELFFLAAGSAEPALRRLLVGEGRAQGRSEAAESAGTPSS